MLADQWDVYESDVYVTNREKVTTVIGLMTDGWHIAQSEVTSPKEKNIQCLTECKDSGGLALSLIQTSQKFEYMLVLCLPVTGA